ncbi:MAG: SMC-Scp complex subunit ScpB [Cytophagales bacterium]|nr:SMC-Scp complex subunit ScpB [Cytophagales bacterium]
MIESVQDSEPLKLNLSVKLEALLFVSSKPLSEEDLSSFFAEREDISDAEIQGALEGLIQKYEKEEYAFHIQKIGVGYQFLSKNEHYPMLTKFFSQQTRKRLSASCMETLAIIAYRQPITRAEIETIRGVGTAYALHRLGEKDLIEIKGTRKSSSALLYGTTDQFLDHFGIPHLKDLPSPS